MGNRLLLALTFSVMFSSTSFADWTKVGETKFGTTFYVDFERIRKHGGHVYHWVMNDNLEPDKLGNLSSKAYHQADCKLFRYRYLSVLAHKEPMGKGTSRSYDLHDSQWRYPPPKSMAETILNEVCSR